MSRRKKVVNKNVSNGQLCGLTLGDIKPITPAQCDVFESWEEKYNLFLYGCAGTGKTHIALALAFQEMIAHPEYENLIIVRSAVPSRDMGFMPGSLSEKGLVYELPYINLIKKLFSRGDAYEVLKSKQIVQFLTTSYLRGITFENCIVIADEIQNFSKMENNTMLTRVGNNCRVIICGDIDQNDLIQNKYDSTGMIEFFNIIKELEEFDMIEFTVDDICRSGLVANYIRARIKLGLGSAI